MTAPDAGAVYRCPEAAACPICQLARRPDETRAAWAERVRGLWGPSGLGKAFDGRWSRRWAACRECGTTSVIHSGQGYCARCYSAARRRRMVS